MSQILTLAFLFSALRLATPLAVPDTYGRTTRSAAEK